MHSRVPSDLSQRVRRAEAVPRRATRRGVAVGAIGLSLALAACSSGGSSGSSGGASSGGSSSTSTTKTDIPITIGAGITDGKLGLAQPITATAKGGTISSMTVTDSQDKKVDGTYDAKAGSWHPNGILDKKAAYTVSATATADGGSTTTKRRITTGDASTTTGIYITEPYKITTVGNAQPVVVQFSQAVPAGERKAVQNRLKVSDTSGVEGAWRWLSPTRLDYRPKDFWPVGDKVTMSGDIQSVKIGDTWGAGHLDHTFTVDSDLQAVYDPNEKVVTVTQGGKVVRTMLADGGKKGLETTSGSMVVLGKSESVRMRSCSVGLGCSPSSPNYYDEMIDKAVQITPSGIYLHAAPWDKGLGKVDSSHGCIHLSQADAEWFFANVKQGNLVKVLGNANPVSITNGDGDWNLSWEQWTAPQ